MTSMYATITSKGQITLPAEARRALASKLAPLSEAELEELERSISKVQEILGRVA